MLCQKKKSIDALDDLFKNRKTGTGAHSAVRVNGRVSRISGRFHSIRVVADNNRGNLNEIQHLESFKVRTDCILRFYCDGLESRDS